MPQDAVDVQAEETVEVPAPPVPDPSGPSGPEGSSSGGLTAEDLKAFREELKADFDDRVRQFQKGNDKRFSQLDSLSNLLKRAGVTASPEALADAQRQIDLDELLEERRQGPSVRGGTDDTREVFSAISTDVLDAAGIAYDDADYKAFVAKHSGKVKNPEHWRTLLNVFVDRKGRTEAAPNPAATIAESRVTQSTKTGASEEELRAELTKLERAPKTAETIEKRKGILAQMPRMSVEEARKKGLDPLA